MTLDRSPSPDEAATRAGSRPATRRRGAELEEALLQAAWAIVVRDGYSGLTYEAVAKEAGTARAVLYRRWPQRHLLLEAALRRFWTPIEVPDTGSLRADAIALLERINDERADLITVLGAKLADYYRDTGTTLTELRDKIGMAGREGSFDAVLARALERGELRHPPAVPRIASLPLDLLRHEMMMRSGPITGDVIVEIVDLIWLPLLDAPPRPTSRSAGGIAIARQSSHRTGSTQV